MYNLEDDRRYNLVDGHVVVSKMCLKEKLNQEVGALSDAIMTSENGTLA